MIASTDEASTKFMKGRDEWFSDNSEYRSVIQLTENISEVFKGLNEAGPAGEKAFVDDASRGNDRFKLKSAFMSDQRELDAILNAIAKLRKSQSADPSPVESAAAFVAQLTSESLRHRAVRHPYLQALADDTLPDTRWALADFARQYYGYSAHFPRYLTMVISRLENPQHRKALLDNLTEESGTYEQDELDELAGFGVEAAWIKGIAHPLLFQRFSDAMGVHRGDVAESDQVACWREQFLQLLASGSPAEALGALGLGTENIVRTIYGPFVKAIGRLGDIAPRDAVFFPLHTAVDDHHQETLQAISADFAKTEEGRAGLRRGMLKSLQLRTAFWDWLYERAMDPERAHEVV